MKSLSDSEAWDRIHAQRGPVRQGGPVGGAREAILRRLRGARYPGSVNTHTDSVLWDSIYPACLPRTPGLKVLEVGSAPGEHLITLHQRFGWEPYGVEYSEIGVRQNRELFSQAGLRPENVIHGDVFDERFRAQFREFFDVVISRGFVEHFAEPEIVVARHLELLKPGGALVVSIPNLAGLNYALSRFFSPSFRASHNLSLMKLDTFRRIFRQPGLAEIYCGYLGLFDFDLFWADRGTWRESVRKACKGGQLFLNVLFRILDRKGRAVCPATSPHLIFIGRTAPR